MCIILNRLSLETLEHLNELFFRWILENPLFSDLQVIKQLKSFLSFAFDCDWLLRERKIFLFPKFIVYLLEPSVSDEDAYDLANGSGVWDRQRLGNRFTGIFVQ